MFAWLHSFCLFFSFVCSFILFTTMNNMNLQEHPPDFFSLSRKGLFHADPHPGNMLRTPDGRSLGFQGKDVFGRWVTKWVDMKFPEDRAQICSNDDKFVRDTCNLIMCFKFRVFAVHISMYRIGHVMYIIEVYLYCNVVYSDIDILDSDLEWSGYYQTCLIPYHL